MNKDQRPVAVHIENCIDCTVENVHAPDSMIAVKSVGNRRTSIKNVFSHASPKVKSLVVAIKKPIVGFVKVWHVVGILFTIIVFPFAKDIAVYHYKQYHESTSQEKIQQSQEKHKIDNQK